MKFCLSEDSLVQLGQLPALTELSIENEDSISREVIGRISSACLELRALTVRGSETFDDVCLGFLAQQAHKLDYLDISCCPKITLSGVQAFLWVIFGSRSFPEQKQLKLYLQQTKSVLPLPIEDMVSVETIAQFPFLDQSFLF